jgi:hypothetical protein
VSGKVAMDGKSLSGVVLNLHVITTGSPATIPLTGADFKVKLPRQAVTPGISAEGKNAAAFTAVPKAYREAAMDRAFDLAAGSTSSPFESDEIVNCDFGALPKNLPTSV